MTVYTVTCHRSVCSAAGQKENQPLSSRGFPEEAAAAGLVLTSRTEEAEGLAPLTPAALKTVLWDGSHSHTILRVFVEVLHVDLHEVLGGDVLSLW